MSTTGTTRRFLTTSGADRRHLAIEAIGSVERGALYRHPFRAASESLNNWVSRVAIASAVPAFSSASLPSTISEAKPCTRDQQASDTSLS
jgi:hypothetical protein